MMLEADSNCTVGTYNMYTGLYLSHYFDSKITSRISGNAVTVTGSSRFILFSIHTYSRRNRFTEFGADRVAIVNEAN